MFLVDSSRSMFYASTLSIADMAEIKVGRYCVAFINREDDYRAYLKLIITHLVVYNPILFVWLNI